jgi:hypothetical protein
VPEPARAERWQGRWEGQVTYLEQVVLPPVDPFHPPMVVMREQQLSMVLRLDEFAYDEASGSGLMRGRMAAGDCLVSADFEGRVFFGDDLSPVKAPLVSFETAGMDADGKSVALRASGQREGDALSGVLNFENVDGARPPCSMMDLKFLIRWMK